MLRSKRSAVQNLTEEDVQTTATIRQTCPECGIEEMRYYTLQLRSADEGSTVFYSCECGHKYVYVTNLYIDTIQLLLRAAKQLTLCFHRFSTNN